MNPAPNAAFVGQDCRRGGGERDSLVEKYYPLVVRVARGFVGAAGRYGVGTDDLTQDGVIGLMYGVERHLSGESDGYPIKTFLSLHISRAIMRRSFVTEKGVRLPDNLVVMRRAFFRTLAALSRRGRRPTTDDVVDAMRLSPGNRELFASVVRLMEATDEGHDAMTRRVAARHDVRRVDAADAVSAAMRTLRPQERRAVELRFGLDVGGVERTFDDVGKLMGVTRERVRQVTAQAMRRMQSAAGGVS